MRRQSLVKSYMFFSYGGCLLPLLIISNLFFGWMFFKPKTWLLIEGILILLFLINSYIFTRRISAFTTKKDNVIDVEGQVIEERHKLR